MKNPSDAFERSIRESLEQFEVPYNSADWAQLEKALDGPRNVGWWLTPGMLAALVAGTLVVGGTTFLLTRTGEGPAEMTARTTTTGTPASAQAGNDAATGAISPAGTADLSGLPADNAATSSTPKGVGVGSEDDGSAASNDRGVAQDHSTSAASITNPAAATTENRANGTLTNEHTTGTSRSQAGAPRSTGNEVAQTSSTPKPAAEMTFKASVSKACPGEEVVFKVENMPTDGIYLWNFGDGSFSNKPNPEHTYTKPGNYQVMLSMSAAGVGTIHNKPSSDIITIHEAPSADFHALKQEYEGHMPSVHFENRSNGAKQYHWDFGDGSTSTVAHPDHVYKKKGVYPVKLTVTSERGCTDLMEKEVRVDKDYNLDAPAAFAPAAAETFMPEALRTLGVKFHLMVYSADGQLVYETTDATKPWTGRLNNRGEVMTAGEYVWVVDIRERLHLAETYTGKVTLKH